MKAREKSKRGAELWGKLAQKFEDSSKPRSVDDDAQVGSATWATSIATNVMDAFNAPVTQRLKILKSLNSNTESNAQAESIKVDTNVEHTFDRLEEKEEVLPFRPKIDINIKDIVTAEYFRVRIQFYC
jgi:hypothetical protein